MKIAILTDTNSGISKEEAEKKGIYVIPMPVLIDGEVFYEGENLTEEDFGMSTLFSTVFIRSGSCTPLVSYNLKNHVS